MPGLSAEELALRSGTTLERVNRLADSGILTADSATGRFLPEDVSRVRLAEAIDEAGISLDEMGRAFAAGQLSFSWFRGLLPQAVPLETRTVAETVASLGLPMRVVERMYPILGLPSPQPDDLVRQDDAELLADAVAVFDSMRRDEEMFAAGLRSVGEHLREIAESQVAFFRTNVIDQMFEQGLSTPQVIQAADPVAAEITPLISPLLLWLHSRHWEAQLVQLFVQLVEGAMEEAGFHRAVAEAPPAVAFLDLSGFTALTEEAGDLVAVRLAESLLELARGSAVAHGGRVVKLLGDGAMLHFAHPGNAVACGLELVERVAGSELPPARVGIHAGPMVFRDGDYFGRTVNAAARIVDYARPREVLASQAVATVTEGTSIEFEEIGPVALKGVTDPLVLHSARSATPR